MAWLTGEPRRERRGGRLDRIAVDELAHGPRRELLVRRRDGGTHSVDLPAAMNPAIALADGDVVVAELLGPLPDERTRWT